MKKSFLTSILFFVFTFWSLAGEPVPGAEIIIDQSPYDDPVAYQVTGSSGTITFDHLDAGTYKIRIILPKLDEKFTKGQNKVKADMKSVFNAEKKTYYIREPQGFFAVKFEGLKKVAGSNIAPTYEKTKSAKGEKLLIASFTIVENMGEITIKIEGLTSKEFASKAKKTMHDTAKAVIRNMK